MPIRLLTSGGGTTTIQPTTSATDYTLTIPAVTANVVTDTASSILVGSLSANASSIGVGQTWQNVISSRAVTTEYQNSTGKPIMVSISFTTAFTSRLQLQVSTTSGSGFVIVADCDGGDYYSASAGTDHYATVSAIIPPNNYYKAIAPDSNATIRSWAELR